VQIRKEQMKAFEGAAVVNFEAHVAEKLKDRYPKQCAAMGQEAVKALVRLGRAQAEGHGFKTSRAIDAYIHLLPPLGAYFDRDPQAPWAAQILAKNDFKDEPARIEALRGRALEHLNQIAGPGGEHIKKALARLRAEKPEGFARSGMQQFEAYMLRRLEALYPEKAAAVGDAALRAILHGAIDAARKYGLTNEAGVSLLTVLMFLLGAGFDTDPQFPWAAAVLSDKGEPPAKARKLHEAALAYMTRFES
jgi:hypothetical protein